MFSQKMDSASPCKFKIKGRLGKRNKSKIQMGRKNERVEDQADLQIEFCLEIEI